MIGNSPRLICRHTSCSTRSKARWPVARWYAILVLLATSFHDLSSYAQEALDQDGRLAQHEVVKLCDLVLSSDVREGNRGLRELLYLFAELDRLSGEQLRDSRRSAQSKRALVWGRLLTSPQSGGRELIRFVDVRLKDAIPADSFDLTGLSFPAIAYLHAQRLGALSPMVHCVAVTPRQQITDAQLRALALAVVQELGTEQKLVESYVERFRKQSPNAACEATLARLALDLRKLCRKESLDPVAVTSEKDLESRWLRAEDEVEKEFPPASIFSTVPESNRRLTSVAHELVKNSDIEADGGLGAYWWAGSKLQFRLLDEFNAQSLAQEPMANQAEGVKRAIVLLALLRNEKAGRFLVQRIHERFTLNDPDNAKPICDVAVADLCQIYEDRIIAIVFDRMQTDYQGKIPDSAIKTYASVLMRACGGSAEDRVFLLNYFKERDRKTPEVHKSLSIRRLCEALAE
jgi:hypothetical protein